MSNNEEMEIHKINVLRRNYLKPHKMETFISMKPNPTAYKAQENKLLFDMEDDDRISEFNWDECNDWNTNSEDDMMVNFECIDRLK